MKLAVNFSEALIHLLQNDPGLQVDYIKVPTVAFPGCFSQFEQGERWRPLLPHPAQTGVIALGHPDPGQRFNPEIVAEIIRRTNPPYLSTHLEAKVDYFPEFRSYQHEFHPGLQQMLAERFLQAVKTVKEVTGLQLLVENFPYYTWREQYRLGSEPWFVREICEQGDCGFLLDIAHARCSAGSFGISDQAYINALPLERLREIHLAGVRNQKYGIRDTHTALEEWDYQLFREVLEQARPEIVSLEYGGMPEQILNADGVWEPIARNNSAELQFMIGRIRKIIEEFEANLSEV
ncbi:MAG TPA: DUF692 family protein [Bacillota bacterium]|nr:DUF692 family protein [Bacillota bacterium]